MQKQEKQEKQDKERIKATIVVEKEIWKEFKKAAIDKDIQISELVEELVRAYLKK